MEENTFNTLGSDKEVIESIISLFGITEEELIYIIGCGDMKMLRILRQNDTGFEGGRDMARFASLKFLIRRLMLRMTDQELAEWLRRPNELLNNQTPLEILMDGRVTTLQSWAYMRSKHR